MPVYPRDSIFNKKNLISSILTLLLTFIIPITVTQIVKSNYYTQVSASSGGFLGISFNNLFSGLANVYGPFIILIPLFVVVLWIVLVVAYLRIK